MTATDSARPPAQTTDDDASPLDRTRQDDRPDKLDYLAHLGPHRIAVGNFAVVGIPGLVYAPREGTNLPVVAFGHGWLQPVTRYTELFKHLASWGLIVVAPATETGVMPSFTGLGADLSRALRAVLEGTLGDGAVSGDPGKLGVMGHSMGGAAAITAAAADPAIKAVVAVTPTASKMALRAAAQVTAPGLLLIGADDTGNAGAGRKYAKVWDGGDHQLVQLREVKGAKQLGLAEGKHWTTMLAGAGDQKRIQQATKTLASAFLLRHLDSQNQLGKVLDDKWSGTTLVDLAAPTD